MIEQNIKELIKHSHDRVEELQRQLEIEMIRMLKKVSAAFGLIPQQLRKSFEWIKLNELLRNEINLIQHSSLKNAFYKIVENERMVALLTNAISTVIHNKIIPQFSNSQSLKIKVVHLMNLFSLKCPQSKDF
jgi:hypothetical protein